MKKHAINFSPGPSQLYFTVEDHMKDAFKAQLPSLSHRSPAFEQLYRHTQDCLRELLSVPASHSIYFTASATEIWERIIQNLVDERSAHFVHGAFSEKFYQAALQLNKRPHLIKVNDGEGFDEAPRLDVELIGITHNETSTGVALPLPFIYAVKEKNPDALLAIDAVSSIPFVDFDFQKIDSVYFSVQKGFGLPPGLGVWIVNEQCMAKAEQLLAEGKSIGTHHSLVSFQRHGKKNQTPETPNTLAIYLLGKVAEDMLRRGIQQIRKETQYKAAILYQALDNHGQCRPFVGRQHFRSSTVVVAESGNNTARLHDKLLKQGLLAGEGYGKSKNTQLRFANFPAHSKEDYELLVDYLAAF